MRFRARLLSAFGALGLACAAGTAPELQPPAKVDRPAASSASKPVVLSIVGTNDLHGRIDMLPLLAGHLNNLRAARANDGAVLLLDAGDMFQGTLDSNLTEGAIVVEAYEALGYAAAALGNHEFDYGPPGDGDRGDPQGAIKARVRSAGFAMLSANLLAKPTHKPVVWPGLRATAMIELAGRRVGLIGVLTEETPSVVMPSFFSGLDVARIAPTVTRYASELRAGGAELVVLIAHAGGACTRFDAPRDFSSCNADAEIVRALREVPAGAVDVVIAGHTHQAMAHFVGDVAVVEAYAYGRAFSRVDVRFGGEEPDITIHPPRELCPDDEPDPQCTPAAYEGRSVVRDEEIAALLAPAIARAGAKRREKVGIVLSAEVRESYAEPSELGNLFADLLLEAVPGADVGLMNGGGLRASLPAGELSYGQLYEAMPFDNRLAVVRLSARELAESIAAHLGSERHGIVSIAGIGVRARCVEGKLAVELRRKGAVLPGDEMLRVVVSDYLATGGDDLFDAAKPSPDRIQILPELMRDAFARRLAARGGTLGAARLEKRLELPSKRPVRCK